nr:hypothetical protein CFP56_26083 [Quercus suber]
MLANGPRVGVARSYLLLVRHVAPCRMHGLADSVTVLTLPGEPDMRLGEKADGSMQTKIRARRWPGRGIM